MMRKECCVLADPGKGRRLAFRKPRQANEVEPQNLCDPSPVDWPHGLPIAPRREDRQLNPAKIIPEATGPDHRGDSRSSQVQFQDPRGELLWIRRSCPCAVILWCIKPVLLDMLVHGFRELGIPLVTAHQGRTKIRGQRQFAVLAPDDMPEQDHSIPGQAVQVQIMASVDPVRSGAIRSGGRCSTVRSNSPSANSQNAKSRPR